MVRGQVATEFFIYASVFLIVLIVAFSVTAFIQAQEVQRREGILAQETGAGFADAANLAVRSGRGFHANMTFRVNLEGRPYTVEFQPQNGRLLFNWQGTYGPITIAYPLATYNYQFDEPPPASPGCIEGDGVLASDKAIGGVRCSNRLVFYNDGTTVYVEQPR